MVGITPDVVAAWELMVDAPAVDIMGILAARLEEMVVAGVAAAEGTRASRASFYFVLRERRYCQIASNCSGAFPS